MQLAMRKERLRSQVQRRQTLADNRKVWESLQRPLSHAFSDGLFSFWPLGAMVMGSCAGLSVLILSSLRNFPGFYPQRSAEDAERKRYAPALQRQIDILTARCVSAMFIPPLLALPSAGSLGAFLSMCTDRTGLRALWPHH